MPARWPPRYSSQARDAPEVRMVDPSNPGTASRSGRTSTSTGSALVRRWTASVLASFNRDLLECQVDVDALAPPHQLHDPEDDEAAHEPADEDGEAVGRVAGRGAVVEQVHEVEEGRDRAERAGDAHDRHPEQLDVR